MVRWRARNAGLGRRVGDYLVASLVGTWIDADGAGGKLRISRTPRIVSGLAYGMPVILNMVMATEERA